MKIIKKKLDNILQRRTLFHYDFEIPIPENRIKNLRRREPVGMIGVVVSIVTKVPTVVFHQTSNGDKMRHSTLRATITYSFIYPIKITTIHH